MSNNSTKYNQIAFYLICIGIYILIYNFRWQFFLSVIKTERTYLWAFNAVASLGTIFLFISTYSLKEQCKNKLSFLLGWLPFLSVIPIVLSAIKAHIGVGESVVELAILVFPLLLLLVDMDKEAIKKVIPATIIILNTLLIVLVIGALIDKIFDRAAIKWLASFMTCDRFSEFAKAYNKETRRYFSILGHPLVTGAFANTVYTINYFAKKAKIKQALPNYIEMFLVGIIIVATEGRAGFVVYLLITLLIIYKNIYLIFAAVFAAVAAFFLGFFDKLITRFNASTLDSHRFDHALRLLNDENYPLHFFTGYGSLNAADGTIYSHYHSAFEQPAIVFSFKYGILSAILLIAVPFIFVSYKLIKRKQYQMLILWMLLFAQENVMPWLSYGYDEPLRFYFSTFLLLALSKLLSTEK